MVSNQSLELRKSVTTRGRTLTSKGLIGSLSRVMDMGIPLHMNYEVDLPCAHGINSLSSLSHQSIHLLYLRLVRYDERTCYTCKWI
jgi:hypothetical protein